MLAAMYEHGPVAAELNGAAFGRALCDVEAGLARGLAGLGEIPVSSAEAITARCVSLAAEPGVLEAVLERSLAGNATPVIGLVAALRDGLPDGVAEHVHRGATSQDIVDTALSLLTRRAAGRSTRCSASSTRPPTPRRRSPGRTGQRR